MSFDLKGKAFAAAMMAVSSVTAWTVSTVVSGESLHAAQTVQNEKQDEQLHDHELRTRSLEGVVQELKLLNQSAQEQLKRLIALEEEHSRRDIRK
jgi:type II secretory pathway predicted ATPase ExeA